MTSAGYPISQIAMLSRGVLSCMTFVWSTNTVGRRALFVAGPTAWNWLPDYLRGRDPSLSEDTFRRSNRHTRLRCIRARSAWEALRNCTI